MAASTPRMSTVPAVTFSIPFTTESVEPSRTVTLTQHPGDTDTVWLNHPQSSPAGTAIGTERSHPWRSVAGRVLRKTWY